MSIKSRLFRTKSVHASEKKRSKKVVKAHRERAWTGCDMRSMVCADEVVRNTGHIFGVCTKKGLSVSCDVLDHCHEDGWQIRSRSTVISYKCRSDYYKLLKEVSPCTQLNCMAN